MQKVCLRLAAILISTAVLIPIAILIPILPPAAVAQVIPAEVGLRYGAQLSNGPAGQCGCFTMQGAAADLNWNLLHPGHDSGLALGLAADFGGESSGNVNNAGYGLTLTTYTAGPRLKLPGKRVQTFAQALFGLAHGSASEFPQSGALTSSANSFALDLGAGLDVGLDRRFSLRVLQLGYLRTALPNNSTNWQNNLRIGAGVTLHIPHH